MNDSVSVYIHIPFCKNICSYCDFCKFYYEEKWADKFLEVLKEEILERYMDESVKTIYIGGGTPSALSEKQLKELFNIIKIFKKESSIEFTFECNLNDINDNLIKILSANGVNRISIGIESFNKNNLKLLNRNASYVDAQEKIKIIKKYGINNINVDLIYALKNESIFTLRKDLRLLTKLDISHISTYSLILEEHTKLYNEGYEPVDENIDAKMYHIICRYLKRKKFHHYELSNFAKEGYESKHNLVYWNNESYYGFGVGASGYINGVRYENTKNLKKYFNKDYIFNKEILSEKDIMDYEIILGLRKIEGINIKKFYDKFHVNIQSKYPIEKLILSKDLIHKEDNIYINPERLYLMNEILVKLL